MVFFPHTILIQIMFFRLSPKRPADLKEAFNTASFHPDIVIIHFKYVHCVQIHLDACDAVLSFSFFSFLIFRKCHIGQLDLIFVLQKWPSSDAVKGFKEIHTSFFQRCKELSLRVLRVMALSLGLDPDVFLRAHLLIGSMVTAVLSFSCAGVGKTFSKWSF